MPEIRYYTVTQEREVKVSANSLLEAAQIANVIFGNKDQVDDAKAIHMVGQIRERDLVIREDY
jgi:hypothetical protein